jgi:adenylate cyclase
LVGLGFPIAITLAWAFDLGPGGMQRTPAGGALAEPTCAASRRWAPAGGKLPRPAADVRKSIAVLPFVNMSGDPENEYFSDGIAEEILNLLVKLPQLARGLANLVVHLQGQIGQHSQTSRPSSA